MSLPRDKAALRRFYTCYGYGALALYGLLLVFVFPWWFATNHPLMLTLGAHPEKPVELAFNEDGETVPVVPVGEAEDFHWYWGTELPARPEYRLSLVFPEGTRGEWVLSEFTFITLSPERTDRVLDLEPLAKVEEEGIRLRRVENGWGITASPGARLPLPLDLPGPGLKGWITSGAMVTLGYGLAVGMALLLVGSALQFPDRIRARRKRTPHIEAGFLVVCVFIGAIGHLFLVGKSMPDYWPADSTSYAMKAVSLAKEVSYDTGTHEYELNRMPGYPLFMAWVFTSFGWDLNIVAFTQGVLFCLSILLLGLSMVRFIHGYLLGPVAIAALLSPPVVWASRQIATEPVFVSVWMLSLAAFIYLWQRSGLWRVLGYILFGLGVTAAVSIRPNGILLLVLPAFLFLGALGWALALKGNHWWKVGVLWQTAFQTAIPVVMVGVFLILWSWRNYESRGYGKPTDLTEIVYANAPFFAGTFDLRAAKDREEAVWFVNQRKNSGYWFHGWSLRKHRFREITDQYQNIEDKSILELERELADFNGKSDALIPLRAKLAGLGRVAVWGFFFPRISAHTMDPLNQDYRVLTNFVNGKREEQVRKNIRWATRNVPETIEISKTYAHPLISLYNVTLVPLYPWLYRVLFLMALLGWLLAVAERKYLAVALITPYLLNVLLNVYFMYIVGRYVQVLDTSLWFAAVVGIATIGSHSLQEPTPDTDRRCHQLIRPKRLLKPLASESGTRK